MRKYFKIIKVRFSNNLAYRTDFLTMILLIILSTIAEIILWYSVFDSNDSIGGYDIQDTMKYYLLIPLAGSITFVSLMIGRHIKHGRFSNELLRPYKIIKALFFDFIGRKLSYITMSFPIFATMIIVGSIWIGLDLDIINLMIGIFIALGGTVLHFLLELNIGWFAFWLDDVWAFRHFKSILLFIFSGMGFPLAFLPERLETFFKLMPFRYLYDVPVRYMNGNFGDMNDVLFDVCGLFVWLLVFYFIAKVFLKAGLKKYGAFGN